MHRVQECFHKLVGFRNNVRKRPTKIAGIYRESYYSCAFRQHLKLRLSPVELVVSVEHRVISRIICFIQIQTGSIVRRAKRTHWKQQRKHFGDATARNYQRLWRIRVMNSSNTHLKTSKRIARNTSSYLYFRSIGILTSCGWRFINSF